MRDPLLVMGSILLLPLIPAAILYLILSPKGSRSSRYQNRASGAYESNALWIGKFRMDFNVFGSSAVYVVLLAAAYFMYSNLQQTHLAQIAMQDKQAWRVEVPVHFQNADDQPIPANGQMQSLLVELEPRQVEATATLLSFWVRPNDQIFPTVTIRHPKLSLSPAQLDLNDKSQVRRDIKNQRIKARQPAWIKVGEQYTATPSYQP